jgi:hypothetical protein
MTELRMTASIPSTIKIAATVTSPPINYLNFIDILLLISLF